MRRFGFSGLKFSSKQQGARRYLDADVKRIEELCGVLRCGSSRHAQTDQNAAREDGAAPNKRTFK